MWFAAHVLSIRLGAPISWRRQATGDHGIADALLHLPPRLITAQPQSALQLKDVDALLTEQYQVKSDQPFWTTGFWIDA